MCRTVHEARKEQNSSGGALHQPSEGVFERLWDQGKRLKGEGRYMTTFKGEIVCEQCCVVPYRAFSGMQETARRIDFKVRRRSGAEEVLPRPYLSRAHGTLRLATSGS